MAIGLALSFTATLLLRAGRCEFIVLGEPEPQTELLRLVDRYRVGPVSLSDLAPLSVAEFEAFIQRVDAVRTIIREELVVIRRGGGLTVDPDDSCLQAASLLETELAMTFAAQSRWDEADAHFDTAWNISQLVEVPMSRLAYQRDWLVATGLFLHQLIFANVVEEAFERADRFLHNAVERYPDDPEVLLAAGSLLEWSGSLRWGVPAHLQEAEELYDRARRAAPSDSEILLRHGRSLEKLGRGGEAEVSLLQALELPAEEDVHYRARMTLGRIAERDGRLTEAIAHYEAATKLIASWQIAHLALSHALHTSGTHGRARECLDRALSLDMEEADQAHGGWWSYELGIARRFEPLLERMRAEVRR